MRSFSTKLIAVFIAVVMVVTAVPFTVFAATSHNTPAAAAELKAKITAYEDAMDGKVYNNMKAAYDAYIAACIAYDSYVYGNKNVDVSTSGTAYTNLNTALNNMTQWSRVNFTAKAYHEGNVANNAYSNVVYCTTTTNWSGTSDYNNTAISIASRFNKIAMPTNIVFAYDGTNDIYGPVLYEHYRDGNHNTNTKYVYPTDSNWEFRDYWYGYYNANDHNYQMWPGDEKSATNNDEYFGYSEATEHQTNNANNTSSRFFWNKLYFKGTGDTTNYYTKTYRQNFYMKGWQNNTFNSGDKYGTIYSDNTQYVINYEPVIKALDRSVTNSFAAKLYALRDSATGDIPVENYKNGSLGTFLAAVDALTSINPNTYSYSSGVETAVQSCANDIKSAVNSTATPGSVDAAGYAHLRTAITAGQVPFYDDGSEQYTPASWSVFNTAFTNAENHMKNLANYGSASTAESLATALDNAVAQLETNIQYADTTELEMLINEADIAIAKSHFFNTVAGVTSARQDAIDVVWGGNYLALQDKLHADQQATVTQQEDLVRGAIGALTIKATAAVSGAGNESLSTIDAWADSQNASDYKDFTVMTTAIANAENSEAMKSIAVTTPSGQSYQGAVNDKISAYSTIVVTLADVRDSLEKTFIAMDNGQIISEGDDDHYVIDSYSHSGDWSVTLDGKTNIVLFRKTHSAADFKLPNHYLYWYVKNADRASHLDSLNMDDNVNGKARGEISGGVGNNDNFTFDTAAYPGQLTTQSTATAGVFTLGRNDNIDGTGMFVDSTFYSSDSGNIGKDMSGTGIPANSTGFATDFTDLLATTEGRDNGGTEIAGVVSAKGDSTRVMASYSLHVNGYTPTSLETLSRQNSQVFVDNYSFSDKNFGAVYWWKNTYTLYTYHGYSHDYTTYSKNVDVVDISYLKDLIDFVGNKSNINPTDYTTSTYNALQDNLENNAKADYDYAGQDAQTVKTAMQSRYTSLWQKYKALKRRASNAAIYDALEDIAVYYNAGKQGNPTVGGPWSDASWTEFTNLYSQYQASVSDTNPDALYSNTALANKAYDDYNAEIEAYAATVAQAYTVLRSNADFSSLDLAVTNLRTKITNGQFTKASIQAANAALVDGTGITDDPAYFWLTEEERLATFASEEADEAIAAATAAVNEASDLLVAVDSDLVSAAQDWENAIDVMLADLDSDPDRYDFVATRQALEDFDVMETGVAVFANNSYYGNLSTTGYYYSSLAAVEAEATEILSGNFKQYTVSVAGDASEGAIFTYLDGNTTVTVENQTSITVPYGTLVSVYAADEKKVEWYYECASATGTKNKEKYVKTDKDIEYVIKGNTTFRMVDPAGAAQTTKYRVAYTYSMKNAPYMTEYIAAGTEITLPEANSIARYNFVDYEINGESMAPGDKITVNANVNIIANYEYDGEEEDITIAIANMDGSIAYYIPVYVNYNQRIDITFDGLTTVSSNSTSIAIDEETYKFYDKSAGRTNYKNIKYKGTDIYGYTVITGDLVEDMEDTEALDELLANRDEGYPTPELEGKEQILTYGQDYSFYATENMIIIPYSEEEFIAAEGLDPHAEDPTAYINTANVDENGASAFASDNFIHAGTKLSLVSNFVLPDGCEFVEAGILIQATHDGTEPTADLTFKNVGSNGVFRLKSSHHTDGNQFVISPIQIKDNIKNKTIKAKYVAYLIYKDANGNLCNVMSEHKTPTIVA
ncbi:MAG: hypothetical protein IJS03_02880 [Eubacterium sp.]|nr:hypothetical protein [Eubacterium sp.]